SWRQQEDLISEQLLRAFPGYDTYVGRSIGFDRPRVGGLHECCETQLVARGNRRLRPICPGCNRRGSGAGVALAFVPNRRREGVVLERIRPAVSRRCFWILPKRAATLSRAGALTFASSGPGRPASRSPGPCPGT